jgi:hypothetical protein
MSNQSVNGNDEFVDTFVQVNDNVNNIISPPPPPPSTHFEKNYSSLGLSSQNYNTVTTSVHSLITGLYSVKKPELFPQHSVVYAPIAIEQYNNDAWILNNDFEDSDDMTDEEMMMNITQITSLWDQIANILNINMISDEEKEDENFKLYLECVSNNIQYVTNTMIEYPCWNFNPMEKFLWVHLVLACHYESRAIKYLLNSEYFKEDMLTKQDKYGNSCILIACKHNNADIITQLNVNSDITKDMLAYTYDFSGLASILHATMHTDTFMYLHNNIDSINDIIKMTYKNGCTLFLFACSYNKTVARYLLNSDYMDDNYFNKPSNELTCLMASVINIEDSTNENVDNNSDSENTDTDCLLIDLLNSEYCTEELFNKQILKYGNLLTIVGRYRHDLLKLVLDCQYMNSSAFDALVEHRNGIKTNILFECASRTDDIKSILDSPHFNKNLLEYAISGQNILYELDRINQEGLELVISSEQCTVDILTSNMNSHSNEVLIQINNPPPMPIYNTFLTHMSTKNPSLVLSMIKSAKLAVDVLDNISDFGRNLVMVFLQNSDNDITDDLEQLLTQDLLKHKDDFKLNTFTYMCKFRPDIAIKLLDRDDLDIVNLITDGSIYGSPMIHAICSVTHNKDLIKKLLDSEYCNEDLFKIVDNCGNNILLEVSKYNQSNIKFILESKYCTKDVVNEINKSGESCLTYAIKKTIVPLDSYIIGLIVNHPECTSELFNHKNNKGETAFLLACSNGYDITKIIMESPKFDTESFVGTDDNGMNCFTYACSNCDFELVKLICEHPLFTRDMFELVGE